MIPYVTPEDFLAVGDGIADDTMELQNAVNGAGKRTLVLTGTYLISSTITLPSHVNIVASATGQVLSKTPDISLFSAVGKTDVRISGVHFQQSIAGSAALKAGVELDGCTDCVVSGCIFEGMQWAGVYLSGTSNSEISGNRFTAFLGSVFDSGDIILRNACVDNRILHNSCNGGSTHGIFLQETVSGFMPARNLIEGNQIGTHSGYGITIYVAGPGNTYNRLIGNDIRDIVGTHISGSSGAGIYVVGNGTGGTLIADNNIRNCCQQSLDRALAPAAIGIIGPPAGGARVTVVGNNIDDMTQGDGIQIVSTFGGVSATGNAIRMPAANDGTGPGGATLRGNAIRVDNSSSVVVDANSIQHFGPAAAVFLFASAGNLADLTVSGNQVDSAGIAIRADRNSSFTLDRCAIAANACRASGSSDGLQFQGISSGTLTGNAVSCGGIAAYLANCTNMRVSANSLLTTAATGFQTAGTCTGTFYDLSNNTDRAIENGASGSRTDFFASAAPTTGTAAIGDRAVRSSPIPSAPDYWRCTTAGSPGVWKAGAALT
jgi:parallel beta-helix repeat protein